MEVEYTSLRIPFERLSNVFKNSTRSVEKDIELVVNSISNLKEQSSSIPKKMLISEMTLLIEKIDKLKKKIEEINRQEQTMIDRLRSRIVNINEFVQFKESHDTTQINKWYNQQIIRIIHEYLIRDEKYDIAFDFMHELNIEDFSDLDLHVSRSKPIIESLLSHEFNISLKWIQQNRTKLSKTNNPFFRQFEMELRIQEFIQLVFDDKINESIQYSQEHLLNFAIESEDNLNRIKQAMGAIIFINNKESQFCDEFMSENRWLFLIHLFKKVFSKYYQMSMDPILETLLKVGISCLKTTHCYGEHKSLNCPICREDMNEVSNQFPSVLKTNSSLLCPISKTLMDETNYPMAFPNGRVYSIQSILQLREKDKIKDPISGQEYDYSNLKRVYIT